MIELPTSEEIALACQAMPLFPLPGVSFFPHTLLPLHVFESRYRDLVRDSLLGHKLMALPRLDEGWESDYDGRPRVLPVCGMGLIVREQQLPDGRYNVILLGLHRVRVLEEPATDTSYRVARVALLEDDDAQDSAAVSAASLRLQAMLSQVLGSDEERQAEVGRLLSHPRSPDELCDMAAHLVLREPRSRQRFLSTPSLLRRHELVIAALLPAFGTQTAGEA